MIKLDGLLVQLSGSPHTLLQNSNTQFLSSEIRFVHFGTNSFRNSNLHNFQADPITPFASAQKTAELLGDNAFLVHQLGFGHTSLAQTSSCTLSVMINYIANSTVSVHR